MRVFASLIFERSKGKSESKSSVDRRNFLPIKGLQKVALGGVPKSLTFNEIPNFTKKYICHLSKTFSI